MSLDGYIAGPKGEFDWITMDPDMDFGALFKRYDTRLMGRKSWDEARKVQESGAPPMEMPTYVFSRTLTQAQVPGAILSNDLTKTVTELKRLQGKDIWLWGGGELFRSMLELRLVDAVEVAVIPILLGDGIRLLPQSKARASLALTGQKLFKKTGTILLNYDVT